MADTETASLIRKPNEGPVWTVRKLCDARTAMARALAEYLEEQECPVAGMRIPKLKRALYDWPEPEKNLAMPSVTVLGTGEGDYNNTSNGKAKFPVVADPKGTEVNQAYLGYLGLKGNTIFSIFF